MSSPDRDSRLAGFGETLRRARTVRSVSLDDASKATKIRRHYLEALERGVLTSYQSNVFAAGHIRIYGRFLQVDPTDYVAALKTPASPITLPPPVDQRRYRRRRPRRLLLPAGLVASVVALSAYLSLQYAAFVAGPEQQPSSSAASILMLATPIPQAPAGRPVENASPVATSRPAPPVALATIALTPTTVPISPTTATPNPTATRPSGVMVEATMLGRVWLQIEADGRVVFSGILNAGDNRSWSASQQLMLWTGDAANVQVTYNGKSLGRLGSPGQVLKVTWTATV